jgi:hypothetical protein
MTTIENLSRLKGKTIENVTAVFNEDGNARSFILYFTNGEEMEFYSSVNKTGNEEWFAESEIVVDNLK